MSRTRAIAHFLDTALDTAIDRPPIRKDRSDTSVPVRGPGLVEAARAVRSRL